MNKYKVVGVVNLLFGVFQIIYPLLVIFFTLPRLTELYSELNIQGYSFISTYLIIGFVMLIGIGNFFFGLNLISKSEKKEKYFKYALMLIIASFLFVGILFNLASLSTILPIYNLTSQF